MHESTNLNKALERWNQMAEAWNTGMSKKESMKNHPKAYAFVKFANLVHINMCAAAKLCHKM